MKRGMKLSANQGNWNIFNRNKGTEGYCSRNGSINNHKPEEYSKKNKYAKQIKSKCSEDELVSIISLIDSVKNSNMDLNEILPQVTSYIDNKRKQQVQDEVERLLSESRELYRQYLKCEPKRNEFYRNTFYGDLGVLNCMKKYCKHVRIDLLSAETTAQMRDIVWGNYLQFFIFALWKLNEASSLHEDIISEDCGRHRDGHYENLSSSALKEMLEADKRMLRVEEERRQKRKVYESAETQLKEMYPMFEFLKKPDEDTSANEYEKKALELKEEFVKILERFYDEDELVNEGVK